MEAPKRTVIRRREGSSVLSSSRGKATTAERQQQGGAAQAQKAATSKPTVKRDEHGVPTGPKLKYSVLVQQAEGVCDTTLASYFAQWGVVVSVKKLADSHGFVTFNSAASVVALLDRPPTHSIPISGSGKKGAQPASKKVRVLPRLVPTDTFWAEKEHQIEAALAQLEDPQYIKPTHLRFREDKRRPTVLRPGQAAGWTVELCNDGAQDRALSSVLLVPAGQEFRLFKSYLYEDGAVLKRDSSLKFNIEFKPREPYRYGILRCLLIVSGRNFSLHHYIKVEVSNEEELKLLAPTAAYKPRVIDDVVRTIIPAFPPARASKSHLHTPVETSWVERLDEYPIPQNLQDDVAALGHSSSINPWLTRDNYRTRLHNLLWLEEAQGVVNMRKFDLTEITLEPLSFYEVNGKLMEVDEDDSPVCKLEIPGLAEGRPSVLANDIVYVWLPGTTDYEYEGFVHNVGQDHVLLNLCLDFHRRLADNPHQKYNVRFAFNRLMLRMQHRAVDKADIKLVWPEAAIDLRAVMQQQSKPNARAAASKSSTALQVSDMSDHINWFDQGVSQNKEQALAVREVVKRNYGDKSQPMLLFGAFGTGKTRTLVEALKQIITLHPSDAKILICAPSNSAADVFVQHLAEFSGLDTTTLFRLYALHRPVGSVPISVVQFTSYSDSAGLFLLPPLASLLKYKVIVTTAHTSSNLFGVGVKKGHFTHIILDEAAQMMEAEALIPLTLADERSVIIMAGDYRQLGPHLVSPSSKLHGLDKSIMERMANLPTYQCCTNHCLLELVKNYRSHPAILAYPSKHFYNGKLSAMAPPDEVNQLCGWKMLPNPKFPMLFCGVEGEDKQEGDSPSFFNPHEAIVVADLVMSLLKEKKLSEFDIGVISPFRKQITKIRSLLRSRRVWNVRVDSVNEMQGKERKAIIISTVRASRDWKEHDRVHGVGFLSDVRRLNTAITRARCLLAVVGDPYVLYQDAHWRDLIQYCQSNNSYIGPEIRLDNFEAREKKEQQHKESQQLKQQQQQQKQEEQQRQQQQLQLQKQEEDGRLKQQQQFQLQLQQQQQQLAEQQKRQSQQPATKESHPPPSPTQPPQNQHTQPPKPSAWQPLPAAVETERATLAPAPTTAQLLLGSAPPAMLPATQNPPPAQQLPPQGGFVVHAPAAAHPWPWNGHPPQQHPLHPYHTTLGQHQSMPVVFNPHSLPYFTPSVLHPSQLPAMPHHLLAQPPIPAPAAFQPPPTVDTAAATTPGSAIAVVSVEERRANELLARQMMAPQPRPLPGLADESEAEEEQNEYAPLYAFEGQPLIMAKKTAPGYPAVMINEKDGALVVKISLFGLSVTVQRNGQLIYVRLREAAEVKNALFTLPLLHPMPISNGKRSKKAQSGERAVLLVAVPQGFDQSKTKFEEGQTLLIITMVRPALSTRLLTVTTTKTDLL